MNRFQRTIISFLIVLCMALAGCGTETQNSASTSVAPNAAVSVSAKPASPSSESAVNSDSDASQAAIASTETQISKTSSSDSKGKTSQTKTRKFDLSNVPACSHSPYAKINNNIPSFSKSDLTTKSFETYSSLDSLGRCGVAYANVCKDTMPTEKRGPIGSVKPSGWHTVKYDCVDGKYLYNRCHLIGYQLSAENANTKNLITGTRYLNVDGMLPFENMVADYIKETNNHVLYRVTPIFKGDNLVASGVHMEAESVEDHGDGVQFNVYCYNVQPGVKINYSTGNSSSKNTNASSSAKKSTTSSKTKTSNTDSNIKKTKSNSTTSSKSTGETYILNTNTHKFHYPSCGDVGRIKNSNKQTYTGSRDKLISQGYTPCGHCDP